MNNYLSIDVGTTCCKCQLFNESGDILEYLSKEYAFKKIDEHEYVDVEAIKKNVFNMIKEVVKSHHVSSICVSSFGESFVLLDKDDNVAFYPMQYTDPRGDDEAKEIIDAFDEEYLFKKTGTLPQAMFSVCKLLYIKKHYPEAYEKGCKALLICDYVGYLLTGERVIDYSLATRTGAFDYDIYDYDKTIFEKFGLDVNLFSKPMPVGTIVGTITDKIKQELGTDDDIQVVLGAQDQVCNAIGCGCIAPGHATDGLGTVECITPVFDTRSDDIRMAKEGYAIAPFIDKGMYCTYIVNYACNSLTNWFKNELVHDYSSDYSNFFEYIEDEMPDEINDIYCLPYFAGSCIPYQDINIKGALIGLTTTSTDEEIYRSILEGLAMEMRFETENANKFGINVSNLVCTGGGSLSKKRLKMKADVQNVTVKTLRSQEGGLCGCAIIQAVALGQFDTYEDACKCFVQIKDTYEPDLEKHKKYEDKYKKYLRMYQNIKNITD